MLDLHVKENPVNAYIDELCELSLTLLFTTLLDLLGDYSWILTYINT